ncbi:hypothetical protein KKE03_02080 [Patescibacteria group bacterium]|nr:hypothetical protein [Patescibacteria group bacterium]
MSSKINLLIKLSPLFLALIMTLAIALSFKFLPQKMPLFYSLTWGEGQLATYAQFLILPAIIILITLVNLVISWQLHHQQSFFKQVLLFSPLVIGLILTTAFIKIVLNFI